MSFIERNLAAPNEGLWQLAAFDAVFRRNMVLYFTPEEVEAQVAVVASESAKQDSSPPPDVNRERVLQFQADTGAADREENGRAIALNQAARMMRGAARTRADEELDGHHSGISRPASSAAASEPDGLKSDDAM